MNLIIAFNTDFVSLERPDLVTAIQSQYAYLLQRYLKYKYDQDANRRLSQGLMTAAYTREANEIQQRRLMV